MTGTSDSLGRKAYALICARGGVTAREIARDIARRAMLGLFSDLGGFDHVRSTNGAQVAVASPDMLLNVFDERLGFLG